MRLALIVLSTLLAASWLLGRAAGAAPWFTWATALVSLGALWAALVDERRWRDAVDVAQLAIGFLLIALGGAGLGAGVARWLAWWTLGYGAAALGFGAVRPDQRSLRKHVA